MQERRRYPRLDESISVGYRLPKNLLGNSSLSADICEAGVRLPTFLRLDPGKKIELKIRLPEHREEISALGEVVWLQETEDVSLRYLLGLRFIDMAVIARDKIRDYIHQKLQERQFG